VKTFSYLRERLPSATLIPSQLTISFVTYLRLWRGYLRLNIAAGNYTCCLWPLQLFSYSNFSVKDNRLNEIWQSSQMENRERCSLFCFKPKSIIINGQLL